MEERFEVADNGAVWKFPSRGKNVLELSSAEEGCFFRMERSKCGKFGELSALPRKFRLHRSADNASAELETESVIPFGCEYLVARECRISSGAAELISDFSAVNFGKVDGIELEPVVFSGDWQTLELLVYGEKKFRSFAAPRSGVLYSGPEPPLLLRAAFSAAALRIAVAEILLDTRIRSYMVDGFRPTVCVNCSKSPGYSFWNSFATLSAMPNRAA